MLSQWQKIDDCCRRGSRWCVRHHRWTLAAIILSGLGLRLLRYWQEPFLSRDGYAYIETAKTVAANGNWSDAFSQAAFSNMPPGFLLLLMAGNRLGWDLEQTGMLWVWLGGMVLTAGIYWCVYGLYHRIGYALAAAVLAAVSPNLIRLGASVLRETPYFACVMLAVGAGIWADRKRQYRYWLIYILAAAGAVLIRKEGVEVLLIVPVWALLRLPPLVWHRDWRGCWFVTASVIMTIISTLAILLPVQWYYNYHYQSQWQVIPLVWSNYIWSMFTIMLKF